MSYLILIQIKQGATMQTKIATVLNYLSSGKCLTKSQANKKTFRTNDLGGIINVLRNRGHDIMTEMRLSLKTNEYFAEYFMVIR